MSRVKILVAEDDAHIRAGLGDALEGEGYEVESVADGKRALEAYRREHFDLIVLDIMMPETNGYEVCRTIRRADSATPIVMLTAKGEEVDKVVGLELGADDYITKPFGVRELLARVAAALRRARAPTGKESAAHVPDAFPFGAARIDRRTYTSTLRKKTFPLTARELKLLETLYLRRGDVLSRDELLNTVWGVEYYGTTRTLDQHVAQLRKKVELDPAEPRHLQTVHGVGYRYVEQA